ncbi:ferredoxin--NADP reductase, partial [Neorhizobium galegae]|nr:ferredoxin--NADP reductase [Neorhizobium galegae]
MNAPAKTEEFAVAQVQAKIPDGVYAETVLAVEHYTDRLFRFRMTRPAGFRFRSGEFAMIGLMVGDK